MGPPFHRQPDVNLSGQGGVCRFQFGLFQNCNFGFFGPKNRREEVVPKVSEGVMTLVYNTSRPS